HCAHDTKGVKVRVWRSQQRLECANLLALLLSARANPQRVGLPSRKTQRRQVSALQTLARVRNNRAVPTPALCDALNNYFKNLTALVPALIFVCIPLAFGLWTSFVDIRKPRSSERWSNTWGR